MAKQESIGFLDFKNKFNSEEACREHLFKMRWPDGFKCPKCEHDRANTENEISIVLPDVYFEKSEDA